MAGDVRRLHFSTSDMPPQDRVAIWREVIGHAVLRLEIEPLRDVPFQADVTLQGVPGLAMLQGVISGSRSGRTPALLCDGIDDFGLVVNLAGPYLIGQRGRELVLGDGEATIFSCAEVNSFMHRPPGRVLAMRVPRTALAPLVVGAEDSFLRRIDSTTPALRLLINYIDLVRDDLAAASSEMQRVIVSHIHDIVALAIGATSEATDIAHGRGVPAARLHTIKKYVADNLAHADLSVATVAARQGVTPRYVQMLFEADATTFSEFVLSQRLIRAHQLLGDPRLANRTVASIAFMVGFGDLSYFNRSFRQRFGVTPSEVRLSGTP